MTLDGFWGFFSPQLPIITKSKLMVFVISVAWLLHNWPCSVLITAVLLVTVNTHTHTQIIQEKWLLSSHFLPKMCHSDRLVTSGYTGTTGVPSARHFMPHLPQMSSNGLANARSHQRNRSLVFQVMCPRTCRTAARVAPQ